MSSTALPKRSTRGRRMNKLLEDEDSADEEFWGQDAFAEEEGDGVYESESEKEDVFDDDFNDDESSSDDEEVHVARERTKKALKAPERKPVKPEGGGAGGTAARKPKAPRVKPDPALMGRAMRDSDAVTWEDGVRKSSRAIVKDIRSKSEAAREAAAKRPAPRRDPNQGVYKPLTQAEILAEAALTEVRNLQDLEHLLNIEEATKRKAERVKKTYTHPSLRVKSTTVDGANGRGELESRTTIELRFGAKTPAPLAARAPRTPHRTTCAVTGKPARYRDPLTGQGYHDAAAFKELRRRHEAGADADADDGIGDDEGGEDEDEDAEMTEAAPVPAPVPVPVPVVPAVQAAVAPKPVKRPIAPDGAGPKKAKMMSLN